MQVVDNYIRPVARRGGQLRTFKSEDGIPEDVLRDPTIWVIWDLPAGSWRLPIHRVGEDPDAYEARLMAIAGYCGWQPPGVGVADNVTAVYRRPINRRTG